MCAVCSSKLPPRSEAWHDEGTKRTVCPSCQRLHDAPDAPNSTRDVPAPITPDLNRAPRLVRARPDEAGTDRRPAPPDGSARQHLEHEVDAALAERERAELRLAEERRVELERRARAELARSLEAREVDTARGDPRPRPEQSEARLSPPLPAPPAPARGNGRRRTKLPQVGPSLAAGVEAEREIIGGDRSTNAIDRALEAARPHGLEIIQSRPWVGTRVESEAIVVGPSGIWVVDGLGGSNQPVERGFLGGHAGSELLNVVGGRTSIITGLLFDSPFQRVPVRGALCFEGAVPSWFDVPFNLAGIAITTPRELIDALFTPLHLDADTRRKVAQHLVNRF